MVLFMKAVDNFIVWECFLFVHVYSVIFNKKKEKSREKIEEDRVNRGNLWAGLP